MTETTTAARFRAYLGISLDGFIARQDGAVDWLEQFGADDYGYDAFFAEIGTIVMGRGSYDAVLGHGEWPYAGKRTLVVTSRPLDNPPRGVEARAGDFPALVSELRAAEGGDVWVFGGGRLLNGFRRQRAVDTFELGVVPVLLGDGIPLFPQGAGEARLTLRDHKAFRDGVVLLTYEVIDD